MTQLEQLRAFADKAEVVPILVHPEPDPDALACALALRALLRRGPDKAPIVTLGEMTRPENRRMADLLKMRVTEITADELVKLERVFAVDFQPHFHDQENAPRLAVIDHHPDENLEADFSDVRPEYGAAATIMTEYLRNEDERRIDDTLATALLYGIKTDTETLERECIGADVEAYAFLQNRADKTLLRKLARPSYSMETAKRYGEALSHIETRDDVAVVFLGTVDDEDSHVLADIADFCLALDEITWSIATAVVEKNVIFTVRYLGGADFGAGDLAKNLTEKNGKGGGHDTMARAMVPLEGQWKKLEGASSEDGAELILDHLTELIGREPVAQ